MKSAKSSINNKVYLNEKDKLKFMRYKMKKS